MSSAANRKPTASTHDIITDVSKLVTGITGVQLGERQRVMVETRVKKRIADLGLSNEEEYALYFYENRETETDVMISTLTTHHTFFFREFSHFEYLLDKGLPEIIKAVRKRSDKTIRIWSAACSRGQEAYSLSMFLNFHLTRLAPDLSYSILGTDVDSDSVAKAKNGVYQSREIKEIPAQFIHSHWARGTGDISDFVKAKSSIKAPCHFEVGNLLQLPTGASSEQFDIIFCRNVFIYFTQAQIKEIGAKLTKRLSPHGILFIGISESFNGMELPLDSHGPSVYKHKVAAPLPGAATALTSAPARSPKAKLLVFCVDDSLSILTLLKQILKPEDGFEVVGTAANGLEAAKWLRQNTADVMTLDIHMPEQDGLQYLATSLVSNHPPVVMISSVSREDSNLAIQCLDRGASDYIEKPSIATIRERGDEIRTKLRCAVQAKSKPMPAASLDRSFAAVPKIVTPEACFRLILASLADRSKLKHLMLELKNQQPPTLVLFEGAGALLGAFANSCSSDFRKNVTLVDRCAASLASNSIGFADFAACFDAALEMYSKRRTSILVYSDLSKAAVAKLATWPKAHLLLEENGSEDRNPRLVGLAQEVVPHTSFAYISTHFLSRK